jgi:aminopeptidase 2
LILDHLCRLQHEECVSKSRSLFEEWTKKPSVNSIDANLRQIVYSSAIRSGGRKEWNFMRNKLAEEKVDLEKERILVSLSSTRDADLIKQLLNETLKKSLQSQGLTSVYRSLTNDRLGSKISFDWLDDNWQIIRDNLGGSFASVFEIVKGFSERGVDEGPIRFQFGRRGDETAGKAQNFKVAIESAQLNARWVKENVAKVSDWIRRQIQ